jgi:hypothetical protein
VGFRSKINILQCHDPISNVYKIPKYSNFAGHIIYTCEVRSLYPFTGSEYKTFPKYSNFAGPIIYTREVRRLYPFTGSEYKNTNACYR